MPLLAAHGARLCPKKAHMTTNSNLHLFWQFDISFPMCGILLPLTQIWLNLASLSRDTFSSWLNFQAPSLTAQVKGAGVCLPATGEHQTCRKHSSKFFLLLQLIWTFCWLQQIQALLKDISSTYLFKTLSFPHSNLPRWDPVICIIAQRCILAFARLQHFPCELSCKLPPWDKGKANLPMKVTALLETHSVNWLVPYPLPFLSAHIRSHLHGDDSTAWQDIDSLQGF